jgi:hypothetical protein
MQKQGMQQSTEELQMAQGGGTQSLLRRSLPSSGSLDGVLLAGRWEGATHRWCACHIKGVTPLAGVGALHRTSMSGRSSEK